MIWNLNLLTDSERHCDVQALSPLALAFVGDTVFDLFVREMLVTEANRPANKLHKLAVERVCAKAQANAARLLLERELLSEAEAAVLKRGRNAHSRHLPKNASEGDYHMATGLEALFGYLYLSGEAARLKELFLSVCSIFEETQEKQNA